MAATSISAGSRHRFSGLKTSTLPTSNAQSDSVSSSYSQQSILRRRSSGSSSLKSVATRDTAYSDDGSVRALASPATSIKSGRRHSRPRIVSLNQARVSQQDGSLNTVVQSTQLFSSIPSKRLSQPASRPSTIRSLTSPDVRRIRASTISRTLTQPERTSIEQPLVYQMPSSAWSNESLEEQPAQKPVTQYWTSDETRRKEYADIDRSSKGLRGMWNKVAPKFARTGSYARFYDEKDGSDAGSVRRFRLDL